MSVDTKQAEIRAAGEVESWLSDVRWAENIAAPLLEYKQSLSKSLTQSTLGNPYILLTKDGPREVKPEALAGRIAGIEFVLEYINKVLAKGYKAEEALTSAGYFDRPSY